MKSSIRIVALRGSISFPLDSKVGTGATRRRSALRPSSRSQSWGVTRIGAVAGSVVKKAAVARGFLPQRPFLLRLVPQRRFLPRLVPRRRFLPRWPPYARGSGPIAYARRLTMMMPALTSTRDATARAGESTLVSPRSRAERITPKTGLMKPKTATRETSFAAMVADHSE